MKSTIMEIFGVGPISAPEDEPNQESYTATRNTKSLQDGYAVLALPGGLGGLNPPSYSLNPPSCQSDPAVPRKNVQFSSQSL